MKIFIAGTGRVAKYVIEKLVTAGHTVCCGSRHPDGIAETDHCKPVFLDLHAERSAIEKQIGGFDAVYFLAGSRGKDLLQTDAFGAVKLMQAAEQSGIRRFIMLSSIFALEPDKWAEEESLQKITNYNIAKFFADNYLINCTGLDYTIIQPSVLKEEEGTGMIEVDPEHDGSNPIPDVAEVLCAVLERENTFKKVIKMRGGNTLIDTALAEIS